MPSEEELNKVIPNIIEIEKRYVGVIKSEEIEDFKNIKFIGRLAEWNHRIHTEEIVNKAIKIKRENI
jgi:hypothetical protein